MRTKSHFQKVTSDILASLAEIVGTKNVLTGDERENYSRDEQFRARPFSPK